MLFEAALQRLSTIIWLRSPVSFKTFLKAILTPLIIKRLLLAAPSIALPKEHCYHLGVVADLLLP